MKNFRKVLALVLVVATLFSFVAMTSAKSLEDYSDAADVNYVEAVEVLSALGIINGYDGAFHPADDIDRDEMAKMVACLRNAGDIDPTLYASANKFADAKGSWAEGYIAYCAQLGIVAGRNASTFDPDGKVTGVEVLKMLLCTLGYKAEEQGYVGANWQVNVLRDARRADLFAGLNGMDVYAPATRDQAAQMFLNALKAKMVYGYISENVVKLTNALYNDGTLKHPSITTVENLKKNGWEIAYGNAILSKTSLYEIFGGVDAEPAMDCFGRPATLWTITNKNGGKVLKKTFSNAPDFSFTEDVELAVELGGLFSYAMGNNTTTSYNITAYVNGVEDTSVTSMAQASKLTGNGTLTEVFVNDTDIIVVVIETFIAKVDRLTKQPAYAYLDNGLRIKNTLGLEEDDVVMYHQCAGAAAPAGVAPGNHGDALAAPYSTAATNGTIYLHDIWVATPTVEEVIYSSANNTVEFLDKSYFETASQKFEYAANYGASCVYKDGTEAWVTTGAPKLADLISVTNKGLIAGVMKDENVYDVYVNEYGYVMYFEEHNAEPDYKYGYIVEGTHNEGNYRYENSSFIAERTFDIVDFNGAYNNDVVAEATSWNNTLKIVSDTTPVFGLTGYMVRYFENEDGEVEIDEIAAAPARGGYVEPGVAAIIGATDAAGRQIVGNNKTQYMIRTYNFATQEYTYDVYTGYKNLPQALMGYKWVNDGVGGTADGSYMATLQYLTETKVDPDADAHIATHVFIDAVYAGAEETFYLLSHESVDSQTSLYPFINDFDIYAALIDGERVMVAIADDAASWIGAVQPGTGVAGNLYKARMQVIEAKTMHDLPIYVAMEAVRPVTWDLISVGNGLLTVNNIMGAVAQVIPGTDHVQIDEEAIINVVYPEYTEDPMDVEEDRYEVFAGEDRDADFNAIYSRQDWTTVEVYAEYDEVSTFDGSVYNVTNLWIKLSGRVLN